jgi:hypothetical protein
MRLDIAFSDHHLSMETLKAFGAVVKSINRVCVERELRFWSFIYFVSTHHPDILHVELARKRQAKCEDVIERAKPPPVEVMPSPAARWFGEVGANDEST